MSRTWVLLFAVGCGSSTAAPADDVMVSLASVTLGEDCGGKLPAPAATDDAQDRKRAPKGDSDALASSDTGCAQTSMTLSVTTHPKLATTAVKIKKVELLDDKGKLLETLTASKASKWAGKAYVPWNESVAANEKLVASYLLTTPNWSKVGGRRAATSKKFQLRVTLDIGGKNKAIDKKVTAAAFMDPQIDT